MASKREVTVTINGKQTVSQATSQADSSLGGFVGKIPGWAKAVGLLAAAYTIVSNAIGAVKDMVLDSIASYDRFAASQTKLAAQSKLTGVSLAELNRLADEGRDRFGLSSVVANDAATTIAKYASRAGDATKANQLLAAALDLGAASGLNAAQTMEALEQGLRGQDEGFDKLLGKNPSSLWKEYADANGLAVGKMTDTQKRMAELTAIMEAGNLVQGSYNDRLDSGAGAQDKLNNKLDEAKVAFGQAIQPARVFIVQGLTTLVEFGGRAVLAVGRIANALTVVFTGAVEGARSALGFLAIGIGKLTRSQDLEDWGRNQSTAFSDFQAQLKKLEDRYLTTGKTAEESAGKQVTATKNVAAAVKATAETAEEAATRLNATLDAKLGKPMQVAIGLTEGAIASLGRAATDQLPTDQSQRFLTHMQGLAEASGKARDRIMGIGQPTRTGADNTKDMAREVEMVARGALDAAESFGVIDDRAARSLTSAVNIATAVGRMATSGFTFAGAVGVIGGVASLVNTMMNGDSDRRRLLRENNARLADVSEGLAEFNLDISGADQQTLIDALTEGLGDGPFTGSSQMPSLLRNLSTLGFSERRLDKIAKDLGVNIRDSQGRFMYDGLVNLLTALMQTNQGPRQTFGNDLSGLEDAFDVNDTGLGDQVSQLGGLGARYSDLFKGIDFSNLEGARGQLRKLFADFQAGRISLGQMGGMSRQQFGSFLTLLIGRIDQAIGATGAGTAAPESGASVPVSSGGNLVVGGTAVPVGTVQDVIKAMDTGVRTILTEHTSLLTTIAAATERSAVSLASIDGKMDELIVVTAGQIEATDAKLEAMRRMAALERGQRPEFG